MSLSASRPRVDVRVIDVNGQPIPAAQVTAKRQPEEGGVKFAFNQMVKSWTSVEQLDPGLVFLSAEAQGFESQSQKKPVTGRGLQTIFILGRPGLPFYYRGGVKVPFDPEAIGELVAVSLEPGLESRLADLVAFAHERGLELVQEAPASLPAGRAVDAARIHPKLQPLLARFSQIGAVEVAPAERPRRLHVFRAGSSADAHDFERRASALPFVAKVGRVVHRDDRHLSFLTSEIVAELQPGADIEALLADHDQLTLLRKLEYAGNTFVLRAPALTSLELLSLCNRIAADDPSVITAEPNLVSSVVSHFTPDDFLGQFHHPLIDSPHAWDVAFPNANGDPLIAIIDEGCDVSHPDLPNIVNPLNFATLKTELFPSPHGTRSAGVAAAALNNALGIAGVAGMCPFMPIQYPLGLSDDDFADMFVWCAGLNPSNPNRPLPPPPAPGAAVISNSWGLGPNRPLSTVVEHALNHVTTNGRGGKGCVVVFAAGNEGGDLAVKQPWAAHPNVIAVASSSIDPDSEKRVESSNFGAALDLCAPGGDETGGTFSTTAGTAPQGGTPGLYEIHGQTSCACPQVAGVAALMLRVNPNLTAAEVHDILQKTAKRIDEAHGQYGTDGHSDLYGFGRLNAAKAVKEALDRLSS